MIDARGVTTDITASQVRSLVAQTDALLRQGRFGALAIVTDSDFAFGMARMYQILAEPLPVQIGVFRTRMSLIAVQVQRRTTRPHSPA